MDDTSEQLIRKRLVQVLQCERDLTAVEADEVAFHLTDWLSDLYRLQALYTNPEGGSSGEVMDAVLGFVAHASAHLAAAHRILMDLPVEDVFRLGAVLGNGEPERTAGEPYPE